MRTIVEIAEEVRQGARADVRTMGNPDFSSCMEAISRLNGLDRTLVCVTVSDGSIMVGGGGGVYVVTMDFLDRIVNVLNDSADADDFVEVTVGGQAVDYPANYVIGFDLVESALASYIDGDGYGVSCEIIEK